MEVARGTHAQTGPKAASPYLDPETGYLRNKVAAQTQQELDLAWAELMRARLDDLARAEITWNGDVAFLQEIHRFLFRDIFDWAGEFRRTEIDKQGTDFVPAAQVEASLAVLFEELRAENLLADLPGQQFVERLAHYYSRLNQIHPFREGNGRTQRAFWTQVALQAGWLVDFQAISKEANNEASRAASQDGDLEPLIAVLGQATSPVTSVEHGRAKVLRTFRRKQSRRRMSRWLRAHANRDRLV